MAPNKNKEVSEHQMLLDAREKRFSTPEAPMDRSEIRRQRQAVIDSLIEDKPVDDPVNGEEQKPIDNPIPVKHNGEEPGEPDKGEPEDLVKIREDVKDFVPQPEGHRVPPALQLNGETGDGGVMPVEARERQDHPLARNEGEAAPLTDTRGVVDRKSGFNEVGAEIARLVDGAEPPAPEKDPEGHEKGLKELSDGTVIDAEGEKHTEQPAGHDSDNPEPKVDEGDKESDEDRLKRLREEYKAKFNKPANARWSAEHLQDLIDEKV